MKPVATKDTQGIFAGDMPYSFIRTTQGVCYVTTWSASLVDRIKFLFGGKVTVQTYGQTMPPMILKVKGTL